MHLPDQLTIHSPRHRQTRHESGIAGRPPAFAADGRSLESSLIRVDLKPRSESEAGTPARSGLRRTQDSGPGTRVHHRRLLLRLRRAHPRPRQQGAGKTFSSGATIITGQLKVELTNLETDKTVAVNISGPFFVSADGNTTTLSGRSLQFGEPGDFGPGSPAILWVTSGPFVVTSDSEGNVTGFTTSGHIIDMCQVLA